jgi:hypothetical protein
MIFPFIIDISIFSLITELIILNKLFRFLFVELIFWLKISSSFQKKFGLEQSEFGLQIPSILDEPSNTISLRARPTFLYAGCLGFLFNQLTNYSDAIMISSAHSTPV